MSLMKVQLAAQGRQTPAGRLEQAHRHVRSALSEIAADSAPSWETLDDVARSLVLALREMEALQLTLAVMQRQERMSR